MAPRRRTQDAKALRINAEAHGVVANETHRASCVWENFVNGVFGLTAVCYGKDDIAGFKQAPDFSPRPIFRTPSSEARLVSLECQPMGSGGSTWANNCAGVGNPNCKRI